MEELQRSELHDKIFLKIGGLFFATHEPLTLLPLGNDYKIRMEMLLRKRLDLFDRIETYLNNLTADELNQHFDGNGGPKTDQTKSWVSKSKNEVNDVFGCMSLWYHASLFRTNELADFAHWGRSEFLTLDEVVWLSVGFEPLPKFRRMIKPFEEKASNRSLTNIVEFISRHRETIRRKFDPNNYGMRPDLCVLRDWINAVKLEVHPDFMAMLPSRAVALPEVASLTKVLNFVDGREAVSMAKLITAMAIDAYGYDPRAKRGNIPKEIMGIADGLGLEISGDTIRKYLKKGAELIPDDWEPS